MPTSRPGSAPVEFWVDGSRRDGAVEEFYTLSSELGRSGPLYLGGSKGDRLTWPPHWTKTTSIRGPWDPHVSCLRAAFSVVATRGDSSGP